MRPPREEPSPASVIADALAVACPACSARPGDPCTIRRSARVYHLARADRGVRTAQRAGGRR